MPGDVSRLLAIMARLRDPQGGCPWDLEQDFASIAPYTIEEAYEVADAIDGDDLQALKDELGDLLLQVVFHAQMAQEQGVFDFGDVVEAICDKMTRRHPHVFGGAVVEDAEAQTRQWEAQKRRERLASGDADASALAGVARGL
ncbi:MAG TPA: MazG family protein, partial [Pseudoxanthomonas sp.]|nr:MazG family protein [Pseudoxanthomonas sp.]